MANGFPPDREANLVTFTQNFASKILSSPTTYSLTSGQATTYGTLSTTFVNSFNVASALATRSPMNITIKDAAKTSLLTNLRMLAKIVQNSPTTTNAMRDDLGLPQRGAAPTPMPAPGTPFKFAVSLGSTGALSLGWKCNNPRGSAGTMYQVWRRIGATGDFAYLGGAGDKAFVDDTIPAGSSQVTYQIQAVRSTAVGDMAQFNVNFGTGGTGGGGVSTVEELAPMRKAA